MNFVEPIRNKKDLEKMSLLLRQQSERNWMLFTAGINIGLRISDLLKLRVRDVKGQRLVIVEQKTKKRKKIQINPKMRREFKKYTQDIDARVFLFRSRQGVNKPLGRSAAYKILRKAADATGLQDIGTHTLRKTFGYHLYKKTKDVAVLQRLFNHSHPSTTLRYIGVDQDLLDKTMEDFSL